MFYIGSTGKEAKPWAHSTCKHCGQDFNNAFACTRNGWWKGEGMFNCLIFWPIFKLSRTLCFTFEARTAQSYWEGGYPILLFRRSEQLQRDPESGTRLERKGTESAETSNRWRFTVYNKWQHPPRSFPDYSQRRWTPSTQEEATVMEALPWLMMGSERKPLPYIFHLFPWNITTPFLTINFFPWNLKVTLEQIIEQVISEHAVVIYNLHLNMLSTKSTIEAMLQLNQSG